MAERDRVERGEPAEQAGQAARREFGNRTLIQEVTREMWGWTSLDRLAQDLRYAARGLRRSPGFALTPILSLALGIGANTAIFGLLDALLWRWLPVHDPQHIARLLITQNGRVIDSFSYPVVRALSEQKQIFAQLAGFSDATFNCGPGDAVERVPGAWVSGEFYEALGLRPALGRLLAPADDQPGAPQVAVISDDFWERKFNRDPNLLGRPILIEGVPVSIVGVSAPGFRGATVGRLADITIPLAATARLYPEMTGRLAAGSEWLRVLARLQPGLSMEQGKARLAVTWPQLANVAVTARMPAIRRKALLTSTLDLAPGGTGWTFLRNRFRRPLLVLMWLVGLVLLIACANLANLLLARGQSRQREIAVRLAIGASRPRLIRQLLTESLLVAFLGAIAAVGIGLIAGRFLVQLLGTWRDSPSIDLTPDWRVLGFTAALALATGIIFGIVPALRATAVAPSPQLKEHQNARTRLNSAIVAAQVALSFMLLLGAGLFVRTFENLATLDPGFRDDGVLLVEADMRRAVSQSRLAFYQETLRHVEQMPGVLSASLAGNTPLSGGLWTDAVLVNGQNASSEGVHFNTVGGRYFETLRTPFIAGRDFTDRDDGGAPPVAIVNEAFVRRLMHGDPLGQRVSAANGRDLAGMQIVGVVKDSVSQNLRAAPPPSLYMPLYQRQTEFPTLLVHASGSLLQVASALRHDLQPKFPGSPIQIHALNEQVAASLVQERLVATLAASFGVLALILAAVGLYGLLAYSVARRTSELGVRMALGAGRSHVLWLVIRHALKLLGAGIVIGVPAAWLSSRLIASMLFGLKPTDLVTTVAVIALLTAIGVMAAYLPARKASRVEPMVALRYE